MNTELLIAINNLPKIDDLRKVSEAPLERIIISNIIQIGEKANEKEKSFFKLKQHFMHDEIIDCIFDEYNRNNPMLYHQKKINDLLPSSFGYSIKLDTIGSNNQDVICMLVKTE